MRHGVGGFRGGLPKVMTPVHDLIILGAGIDGLMTAFAAKRLAPEWSVLVIAANPDPRAVTSPSGECGTFDGLINRYVTDFEGHNYTWSTPMYPRMEQAFSRQLDEGGWLARSWEAANPAERDWLTRRAVAMSPMMADWNAQVFDLYVSWNQQAMSRWRELWSVHADLLAASRTQMGVARFYSSRQLLTDALEQHQAYGALSQTRPVLDLADDGARDALLSQYPALGGAVDTGILQGGALFMDETRCFTMDVHALGRRLVDWLIDAGVEFSFDTRAKAPVFDAGGRMAGLSLVDGQEMRARNYVLAPGAYGASFLAQSPAAGALNGVAGAWASLKTAQGFAPDFKFHGAPYEVDHAGQVHFTDDEETPLRGAPRTVMDQNHLYRRDVSGAGEIIVGGGYAWVGERMDEACVAGLDVMKTENARIASLLYGQPVDVRDEICMRSFTVNDLPLLRMGPSDSGGQCLIMGGMNTGTTTAAALTGDLAIGLLQGEVDKHRALLGRLSALGAKWEASLHSGEGVEVQARFVAGLTG